jgi:hypothetical protein
MYVLGAIWDKFVLYLLLIYAETAPSNGAIWENLVSNNINKA